MIWCIWCIKIIILPPRQARDKHIEEKLRRKGVFSAAVALSLLRSRRCAADADGTAAGVDPGRVGGRAAPRDCALV